MTPADSSGVGSRVVTCPACGGASVYANSNPYRPFCCARCRQLDLGAWASERFRLNLPPAAIEPDDAQWPQANA